MFHVKRDRCEPSDRKHRQVPCLSFHTGAAVRGSGGGSNPQSYPQQYPPVYPPDIHALGIRCDTYGVPLNKTGHARKRCRSGPKREPASEALRPGTQSLVDTSKEAIAASRQLQNGPVKAGNTQPRGQPPGRDRRIHRTILPGVPGEVTLIDPTVHFVRLAEDGQFDSQ